MSNASLQRGGHSSAPSSPLVVKLRGIERRQLCWQRGGGTAVDVTLVDQRGRQLLMLTDFDDFSAAAGENAPGIPAELVENGLRLHQALERRGFRALSTECWHFDWHRWQALPVVQSP